MLSRPEVVADPALVRASRDFGFITGGPGHVVFLGLLDAGIAVPAIFTGMLPRPLAAAGILFAAIAELSTLSIVADPLAFLLPIARSPLLIWLIVAGFKPPTTLATARPAGAGSGGGS